MVIKSGAFIKGKCATAIIQQRKEELAKQYKCKEVAEMM